MKKVLVVDDDRNMNEFISRALISKLKCRVVSVYNGVDVFVNLQKEDFDFIVLDISLPLLHGVEILEIIRSDKRYKHLPVVMMTANREKEIITKLIELGITDYLAKPLTLEFTYQKFKSIINAIDQMDIVKEESSVELNNLLLAIDSNSETLEKVKNIKDFDDIITTESGVDAIKYFIKNKPKAVYIGQNIPVVNEKVLVKTFRQIDIEKNVKIIIKKDEAKLSEEEKSKIDDVVVSTEDINKLVAEIAEKAKN